MKKILVLLLICSVVLAMLSSCMITTNQITGNSDEITSLCTETIQTSDAIMTDRRTEDFTIESEPKETETDEIDITSLTGYQVKLAKNVDNSSSLFKDISFDIDENDVCKYEVLDSVEKSIIFNYNEKSLDLTYEGSLVYENGIVYHRYYYTDNEAYNLLGYGSDSRSFVVFDDKNNLNTINGTINGKIDAEDLQDEKSVKEAIIEKFKDKYDFEKFDSCTVTVSRGSKILSWHFHWRNTVNGAVWEDYSKYNRIDVSVNASNGYISSISYYYDDNNDKLNIEYPFSIEEAEAIAAAKFKSVVEGLGYEYLGVASISPANVTFRFYENKPMMRIDAVVWYNRTAGDYNSKDYISLTAYVIAD